MDAEVKAKKLREYNRILKVIDDCISSKDEHYERNEAILKEILEDVFATIKGRDGFFREQLQHFFFVEKYYKGLTAFKLEEFDVNMIIKIPVHYNDIELTLANPGYTKVGLPSGCISTDALKRHSKFMSKWLVYKDVNCKTGSFIDSNAFQQSIGSLFKSAMLNVPKIDNYTIRVHQNGPAFPQVCVNKQGFPEMKVNLVPVLQMISQIKGESFGKCFEWYAIPDPPKDVADHQLQWKMAFEHDENTLLRRHYYLMPVIRQLERLRDIQQWSVICYYHIKTLVMHYARSLDIECLYPGDFRLAGIKLLIHMLEQLRNVCKTHHLAHTWVPKHNLVDADESQLANIEEQLTRIINEITDDPAKVADWILTSEELSMYANELKTVGIPQDANCPSKNLQMSEDDKPGSSEDVRNTADDVHNTADDVRNTADDVRNPADDVRNTADDVRNTADDVRNTADDVRNTADDVRNTADDTSKPATNATASSGGIESSLSNEAAKDIAGCLEEVNRVVAGLGVAIDMLSRRLTALEQKTAETA